MADESERLAYVDDGNDEDEENMDEHEDESGEEDNDDEYDSENDDEGDSEDFGEKEHDVEEYQLTIRGSPPRLVTLKLFMTADPEFKRWLQTLHITCTHNGKVVGWANGQHINRSWIRPFFYRDMEEPTQDMSCLAYDVFDRYGCLKKEFKEHPVRKGTGKWGSELDIGILFLIESIRLDKEWRRNGLGTIMVKAIMGKATRLEGGVDFTLTIPGWLNTRDLDLELKDKSKSAARVIRFRHQDTAVAFFRSLGFRRIGASGCLGLAKDLAHEAHNISCTDDYDPEETPLDPDNESDRDDSDDGNPFTREQRMEEKRLRRMEKALPVHHAINALPDTQCMNFFKARLTAQSVDDPEWNKLDHARNNVLHVASCLSKPLTSRWLIEHIDRDNKLRLARNLEGYTPLEALQAQLEASRISTDHKLMTICISDRFRGYLPQTVACLGVLQGLPDLSGDRALRLKYGCTCGECLLGFVSPRMKFVLLAEAEMTHDMLSSEVMEDFWCDWNEHNTTYIASALKQNFRTNKSLRKGFANMFDHIASCLRQKTIPTEENVLNAWRHASEWPPVTRNFLEKGGKVENALRAVFDNARDQDYKAGDGTIMEIFAEDILKLPECRNDHEFGFVALACGLEEIPPPSLFDGMFRGMFGGR